MAPADILAALHADALLVELADGGIALDGPDDAIGRWLPTVRKHKAGLIEALTGAIDSAMRIPQPDPENPPAADPNAETEILALFDGDDRRLCADCLHLLKGVCRIAKPGGLVSAHRGYRPVAMLLRCEGYAPSASDPDQRPGAERWQGLRGRLQ